MGGAAPASSASARHGLIPVALEDTDHFRLMREFILDWKGTVETMFEG